MMTCLTDNGYKVDSVVNGVEGLRLVMAQDYDVIVCDIMMPKLAGDMFYMAIERTKPHLCKRFIFISGYKGEANIDNFIRKINGILLWKPFRMSDLLDTIQLVLESSAK